MPCVDRPRGRVAPAAMLSWLLVLAALPGGCKPATAPPAVSAPGPTADPGAARIQADVRRLSDDAMQGRETGTPGYDRAAAVVAERFGSLGLRPAGDDGTFFQRVPLLRGVRIGDGARFDVERRDRTIHLRFADHFLPDPNFDAADSSVRAPAVFVGQGVSAPELQHDDLAGLDLHGRIAVVLGGAPAAFAPDARAFHATDAGKLRALAAHGAIGVVFVDTAADEMQSPWSRKVDTWQRPQLRLRDGNDKAIGTLPQLRVVARVSAAAADLLFDGSGHTAAELAKSARDGTLKGFTLPATLALSARTQVSALDSRNVLAMLPGRDPALAAQQVVFSAHQDHLGNAAEDPTDRIFNGALDNALGVAIVLEAAHELAATRPAAKRSLLFAALTGEEQGLLGAQWLALHPPGTLVADINIDMPMLLAPTRDVVPIGASHSSLQQTIEQAAGAMKIPLSADPFPEESVFVRSDQFAFVRAGIPSLYLDGGVVPAASSAGKRADLHTVPKLAARDFLRRCYHQPCDDVRLPIQYPDAARMARLEARIAELIGNAAEPPRWRAGDVFEPRPGTATASPARPAAVPSGP